MKKLGGLGLFVIMLSWIFLLFQNFTGNRGIDPSQPTTRLLKPNLPTLLSGSPSEHANQPRCENADKTVVYLRFPEAREGERVTGSIEDQASGERIAVDIVLGRDLTVGPCASQPPAASGRLKVCFPKPVGFYFLANFTFDQFKIERTFTASGVCDSTTPISVNLTREM